MRCCMLMVQPWPESRTESRSSGVRESRAASTWSVPARKMGSISWRVVMACSSLFLSSSHCSRFSGMGSFWSRIIFANRPA